MKFLPNERATAKKGISSMGVDLRTGPWCPDLGLFQTTLGTPDLLITFPPHSVMRAFSTTLSGLWSLVRASPCHSPPVQWKSEIFPCKYYQLQYPEKFK